MTKNKSLNERSIKNLVGVHTDLCKIVVLAKKNCPLDFCVIEGLRTVDRQKKLYMSGASKTMRSRHLTGHAVDLAAIIDDQIRWDWPLYDIISKSMKDAAKDLKIPIEWGGDWKTFKDGPHFQLPWDAYP